MPATTTTRWTVVQEFLDALDWIAEGRVQSDSPDDDADVWLKRAELESRCVTAKVMRMAAHGFVERFGTLWRLTPAGHDMRNGIRQYVGSST